MILYPVAISQQDNVFDAKIPDLPNLDTIQGSNMADTITEIRHCIISYLQQLSDNDEPIPVGQELNTHLQNPDFFGHTWAIISLESSRFVTQTLPITLNMPKSLVNQMREQLLKSQTIDKAQDITAEQIELFVLHALKCHLKPQ